MTAFHAIILGILILLIILYFILRKTSSNQSQRVDIESARETKVDSSLSSSSELKLDGEKLEKDLKRSYDEMVGRL